MRIDHLILHQLRLSRKIRIEKLSPEIHYIGAADAAAAHDYIIGCIGVFTFPDLRLVECAYAKAVKALPYIPGFLSFREIPVYLMCYKKLKTKPELLLVDGQGIAHPRALGIASHLGLLLNKPTIGCAKSHLYGDYSNPAPTRGSYSFLVAHERRIGLVLRTKDDVNPLFVSPGNLVDFDDCVKYVMHSITKYRVPAPLRFVHRMAGEEARRFDV